jgi:transcriptional regulator with XRE-family HTH domain
VQDAEIDCVNKTIAQRIRRLRQNADLSQDNVADELGITKGAYSKIERGITAISVDRLHQIAKVLDVHVTAFFEDPEAHTVSAERFPRYGYATKREVEELAGMISAFRAELGNMRKLIEKEFPGKHTAGKKRGGS